MTTVAKMLISEGFQQLGLNRSQARVATVTIQVRPYVTAQVLKKEGVLRQAEWLYDHYVDLTMNRVLRIESKENHSEGLFASFWSELTLERTFLGHTQPIHKC